MSKSNWHTAPWERVGSAQWRANLLREIDALDGFNQLIDHAINPAIEPAPEIIAHLKQCACALLSRHSREELRAARLHYNTQQLIAFWEHYCKLTELSMTGSTENESLPLPAIVLDPIKKQLQLRAITKQELTNGLFIRANQDPIHPLFKQVDFDHTSPPASDQALLDSLQGRFTLAARKVFNSSVALYRHYLTQEQRAASDIWNSYKIHVFLDNFLYQPQQDRARTSRFELIFFANNLRELMIWLDMSLKNRQQITIAGVKEFLARQTKYYLALSQRISLEENEILNMRKDLLYYDDVLGVVRLKEIPSELLSEPKKLFNELEMTSLGCPFGRTKGVQHNALVEIYHYCDNLFVRIMEASWEFPRLFRHNGIGATDQSG